jgi:hypothetical protein
MPARSLAAPCTAVLLLLTGTGDTASADVARGTVFEDRNVNGRLDDGEPGVVGVSVSNGREVVVTDAAGNYRITLTPPAVLFITKPSGYGVPVNKHQLPQFYYIHQPEGSPDGLRYPAVEPTGPLPERIDFPLLAIEEPSTFDALLITDPQPMTDVEIDYVRDSFVTEVLGTDARFGMTMGDILFDDLSQFPRYNSLIAQIGIPWYNVPGNHEMNYRAESDATALETFKRYYGPTYYSFEVGQAHFVVLDNIEYKGARAGGENLRTGGGYEARITEPQLEWLHNDLARVPQDRLVFLAMHSPLVTIEDPDSTAANTTNRRDLFRLLRGRQHLYSVAGHTHTNEHHYFGQTEGFPGPGEFHHHVLSAVSGSWWSGPLDPAGIPVSYQRDGSPRGYHMLTVDGTDVSVRYKAAGMPADYQMRIMYDVLHHGLNDNGRRDYRPGALLDGMMSVDQVPAADILVNLFDGGPNSVLDVTIGERAPLRLERVLAPDPFVAEVFARHRDTIRSWVDAITSAHLYRADLPDDLAPGIYTVTVRATDEFGQVHHGHSILEITGSSATPAN